MDNEIDLVELNEHIYKLRGFLETYKNLPEDAKNTLTQEIEYWEKRINEYE